MGEPCPTCHRPLPKPKGPKPTRVNPCKACGLPVESGKRGKPKMVHYRCRALWRKLNPKES